jgi:hypothetical protein
MAHTSGKRLERVLEGSVRVFVFCFVSEIMSEIVFRLSTFKFLFHALQAVCFVSEIVFRLAIFHALQADMQ